MTTEPAKQDSTDDQELAKALASIEGDSTKPADTSAELKFEETPAPGGGAVAVSPFGDTPAADPVAATSVVSSLPVPDDPTTVATPAASTDNSGLESIKKDALNELRPLVDKLTVPPEEKFDTYLLLLRSTDDTTLIAPAHEAAKDIPDEARRAQALLDVIKEIDYLSAHK